MADVPSNVDPATKSFLGKEMYLVVTRPVRSPEIAKRLGDHLAHQIELEKRGIMFAAGPLYPRGSDTPEAGMFVLRASSFEEAEAIAKEDPLHKAGLRTFTLQKWRGKEGRITLTVDFSDQTMKIERATKPAHGDVRLAGADAAAVRLVCQSFLPLGPRHALPRAGPGPGGTGAARPLRNSPVLPGHPGHQGRFPAYRRTGAARVQHRRVRNGILDPRLRCVRGPLRTPPRIADRPRSLSAGKPDLGLGRFVRRLADRPVGAVHRRRVWHYPGPGHRPRRVRRRTPDHGDRLSHHVLRHRRAAGARCRRRPGRPVRLAIGLRVRGHHGPRHRPGGLFSRSGNRVAEPDRDWLDHVLRLSPP